MVEGYRRCCCCCVGALRVVSLELKVGLAGSEAMPARGCCPDDADKVDGAGGALTCRNLASLASMAAIFAFVPCGCLAFRLRLSCVVLVASVSAAAARRSCRWGPMPLLASLSPFLVANVTEMLRPLSVLLCAPATACTASCGNAYSTNAYPRG